MHRAESIRKATCRLSLAARSFFALRSASPVVTVKNDFRRTLANKPPGVELSRARNDGFSFASQCQLPTQNGA